MPRIIFAGVAVAMTVLLFTAPLQAQSNTAPQAVSQEASESEKIAVLEEQSREAYAAEKWVAFYIANMKLSELRPFEPEYMVNIIRACALLDRKSTAYHYMLKMQQQGMTYDFNTTEDTLKIRDTEAYTFINNTLVDAGEAAGTGTVAFTLPGNPAEFRAIAWDGSRDRFLVGTMREGVVMAVSIDGETEVLIQADDENGIWSISGLAVDVERKRLWISSASTPLFAGFSPAEANLGALFELDLETMELLGRYNLPVDGLKHELGSLALTDDGHVYVINRTTPIIYHKTPEGNRLEAFFARPDLLALRDIAVISDNSRVFVADAYKGILAIDPIGEQAAFVVGPETLNFGGIEGIEYRDGMLFVVQGGFEPQRVVRLELDDSRVVVQSIIPMANALDGFDQPGTGTLQGDNLYYFANSGAEDVADVIVMSTPQDAGVEVAPPGSTEIKRAMETEQRQKKD